MKSTLGVIAGIIIGAIGMELMNKSNPDFVEKMEDRIKDTIRAVKDSFNKKETVEEASAETL